MNPFIGVGIALIVGVLFGKTMNRFKIPAVAGYIIAGLVLGVSGFNLENSIMIEKLSFIGDFALGIIAFNIGSELEVSVIKKIRQAYFYNCIFRSYISLCSSHYNYINIRGKDIYCPNIRSSSLCDSSSGYSNGA